MTIGTTRPGDALSETQRRFLVAVMERVPRELVHEVYLFAPMKQGGVETGIAVVAIGDRDSTASAGEPAVAPVPDEVVSDVDHAVAGATEMQAADTDDGTPRDGATDDGATDDGATDDGATDDGATDDGTTDDGTPRDGATDDGTTDDGTPGDDTPDDDTPDDGRTDGSETDADAAEMSDTLDTSDGGDAGDRRPAPARAARAVRAVRFTVFTARYRLQLKGPDRGKWDVDVVEEADAPLVTVDAVVRGVHRRSGEPSEVERLAPHDLARALGEVPWTSGS